MAGQTITKFEVEDGELVMVVDGVETRMAAGPLTNQLIGAMARGHLEPAEREIFDFLAKTFGGCAGVTVRDTDGLDGGTEIGVAPDTGGASEGSG